MVKASELIKLVLERDKRIEALEVEINRFRPVVHMPSHPIYGWPRRKQSRQILPYYRNGYAS